jgi:hypothetical protein
MTGNQASHVEDGGMISQTASPIEAGVLVPPLWTAVLLAGLLFLPGALGFLLEGMSFAAGTAISCLAVLALAGIGVVQLKSQDVWNTIAVTVAAAFFIVFHLLLATAIDNDPSFDIGRAISSIALFGIIALAIPAFATAIMAGSRIRIIIWGIFGLFVLSAVFSMLKIQPPTASLGEKPTFPFTEPSFLGFSIAATLIFVTMRSSKIMRVLIILTFVGIGLGLSNLTIIAVSALAAIVSLPLSWLALGVTTLSVSALSFDLSYYTDRLDFDWANSSNLSSLVYVQGWQMLAESLQRTHGWGVGFQQLGVVYTNVPASIRINALLGRDANLQDGGFILSKLGSEFGLFGLALVVIYLYVMAQSVVRLRLAAWGRSEVTDAELFARACVIGYLVEVFIRGTNYFTGTLVLMLAATVYLRRSHVILRP